MFYPQRPWRWHDQTAASHVVTIDDKKYTADWLSIYLFGTHVLLIQLLAQVKPLGKN
jgi:hypothetical protein